MKRSYILLVICLIVGSLLRFSTSVSANGYIQINKEAGGDIYKE